MEPDTERDTQQGAERAADPDDDPFATDTPPVEESLEAILEEFVRPFYSPRDTLHGLPHLRRLLKKARYLAQRQPAAADMAVLAYAAYLYGLIYQEETRIQRFLQGRLLTPPQIERILQAARETHGEAFPAAQGDSQALTLEGMILHDARLLEGGRTYLIASALMLGAARGATIEEIVATIEEQTIGRVRCYLPEAQRLYADKEAFARAFLDDLTPQL